MARTKQTARKSTGGKAPRKWTGGKAPRSSQSALPYSIAISSNANNNNNVADFGTSFGGSTGGRAGKKRSRATQRWFGANAAATSAPMGWGGNSFSSAPGAIGRGSAFKQKAIARMRKRAGASFAKYTGNNQNNNNNSWNGNNKSYSSWDGIEEESHDDSEPDMVMGTFTNTPLSSLENNQNSFVGMSDLSAPTKRINYLELDDWMTSLDDASLNRLTTAQLIQRLRSHGLDYKGMKHELIERWKKFKIGKPKTGAKLN